MSDPGPLIPVVLPLTGKTIFSNEAISGLLTAEIGAAITAGLWPPAVGTVTRSIGFTFDGGGSALTAGKQAVIYVPYGFTITGVTMLADVSGSAVVDLWAAPYASYPPTIANTIVASDPPTLATATHSQDTTLTGWTKTFAAGEVLIAHINSVATITQLLVILTVIG